MRKASSCSTLSPRARTRAFTDDWRRDFEATMRRPRATPLNAPSKPAGAAERFGDAIELIRVLGDVRDMNSGAQPWKPVTTTLGRSEFRCIVGRVRG